MVVTKARIIEAIQALPDDATYHDILCEFDRLDLIDGVERGLADIEAGRFITQDEMERRVAEWLK